MTEGNAIEYRQMVFDDDSYVYELLKEAALEIPFSLNTKVEQDKLIATIIQGRKSGKSWVATDANGNVVGCVLARPHVYEAKSAVYIYYIAVLKASRRRGAFFGLMENVKAKGVPLVANVLNGNLSSMVDILVKNGFTKLEAKPDANDTELVWLPPAKKKDDTTP
jgi:hypothetical protein